MNEDGPVCQTLIISVDFQTFRESREEERREEGNNDSAAGQLV